MLDILVVDDSAMDRRVAGGLLERQHGWTVHFAHDGREALDFLAKQRADLILTDLQMPELNGLELVEAVKRDHPLIPVVLMTAQGSEAIAVQALEQGAASYVPKRDLGQELVQIVERVLAVAGERRTRRTLMQRMRAMRALFTLNNDPALLTSLVAHLQGVLYDMGLFDESERLRVGVALEEALLNAAYHGNLEVSSTLREQDHAAYYELARVRADTSPYRDRSIHVDVDYSPQGLRYVVRDEGPGFDLKSLPDPTDPEYIDRPCGRGLLLMRTFMDEVHYNDAGNEVTMAKRASGTAAV
jgi:CheY-like chemotaxis protein/anti-sigma regulatory factor (Ser/Thr protein kinase)